MHSSNGTAIDQLLIFVTQFLSDRRSDKKFKDKKITASQSFEKHYLCSSQSLRLLAANLLLTLGITIELPADDWIQFRGPNGSGVSSQLDLNDELTMSSIAMAS